MLHVGSRRGIRDMQAVKDGILVLAGPDDDKASADAGWTISLWTEPSSAPVARLTRTRAARPAGASPKSM